MGAVRRCAGSVLLALALAAVILVHRRFAWVPVPYLLMLVALPALGFRTALRRSAPRTVRWAVLAASALTFVALLPVPWMAANTDDPPGTAWRLDGRVSINGDRLDPSGNWYWLTVGRPPIIAELVRSWIAGGPVERPTSMLAGRRSTRPAFSEPAAAAVGLRRAGWVVRSRIIVEVSEPLNEMLPTQAVLAQVNGVELTTRDELQDVLDHLREVNTVELEDGGTFQFRGAAMPYGRIDVIELPDEDLDVLVGGALAATLPGAWYRNLSLGSSHGLMVALLAYVYGSGEELARGRTIAGTGKMLSDGTVGAIGGLGAKATAAREIGADVLLFPAQQADQLDGFDAGSMRLVPVASLDDAIAALAG
jgi:PDZ domain-containing secreted protein